MNPINDIDKASNIAKNFLNPRVNVDTLEDLLEASKGSNGYRPYFVAAFLIWTHYQAINRADDVSFQYQKKDFVIEGLLNMQAGYDKYPPPDGAVIPPGFVVDDLLNQLGGNLDIAVMVVG
ncbi:MAG: hypothetical protein KME30_17185 [Iphinoe sp. HA4291-MV1]|jgi:hypothetical protein|nr:hypothetical protein [Iphinoe sp. HA4291-MV1]